MVWTEEREVEGSSVRTFLQELNENSSGEWWLDALGTNYSRGANHCTEIVHSSKRTSAIVQMQQVRLSSIKSLKKCKT